MILFRKEAEQLLKDAGFSKDLTVTRIDKHIYLVGKCGKQIALVSDLEVGNKLSKAERDLLLQDYFIPSIIDHKTDIERLLEIENEIRDIKETRLEIADKEKVKIDTPYYGGDIKLVSSIIVKNIEVAYEIDYVDIKDYSLKPNAKELMIRSSEDKDILTYRDKLRTKRAFRKKVLELYTKEKELEKEAHKIKIKLKMICED